MEYISIAPFSEKLSRIALGTWSIGGDLWGGPDDEASIKTIHTALDKGINLFDSAPAYGNGHAESLLGKAIKENRKKIFISTKCGIEFKDGGAFRNLTDEFIKKDFENSLKRLQTDYIDIYYIHWPDPIVRVEDTAKTLGELLKAGKIRAIGLSNHSPEQIDAFRTVAPCHFCQPPYNIFERQIEKDLLGYCKKNKIALMTYSAICRGLLSGKMTKDREFKSSDLRGGMDPKFKHPVFDEYVEAEKKLDALAKEKYLKTVLELAIRWVLDQGSEIAIWGARKPEQLQPIDSIMGWHVDDETKKKIDTILQTTIRHPQDTSFMGPPVRK